METKTKSGTRDGTPLLDTALDDIVGLVEAYRACASTENRAADAVLAAIRRELGAAADAYAAVVLASAGGELPHERIERAREEAAAVMPAAWRRRKELAERVEAARGRGMDLDLVRDDVRELAGLSLQCRAGLAAFGASPHYDFAAADPVANKVLIELREATLTYLARVRDAGGTPGYPEFAQGARKAAAETIEKLVPRVAELAELEAAGAERAGAPQDVIGSGLAAPMRKIAREWVVAATEQAST
jgi:hypothetical protein